MKFHQQRPEAACLHLLLLLLLLLLPQHVYSGDKRNSQAPLIKGSWQAANHWCRTRGRGGLAQLMGESDASMEALAARTRHLSTAGCYWIAPGARTSVDELHWMADNPDSGDTGCLCVKASATGRASKLRLHLTRCSNRLPFLCQRRQPVNHRPGAIAPTRSNVKKPQKQQIPATKPASVEVIADSEVDDSEDVDSQEDHGKIPKFIEGKGILNPWLTTAAAAEHGKKPPRSSPGKPLEVNGTPATTMVDASQMAGSQRSELVTLLVLYSIVGVVCLVLVALCLIRCLRSCCGVRSRVRYVKHVDEGDIPRFMPSSWA